MAGSTSAPATNGDTEPEDHKAAKAEAEAQAHTTTAKDAETSNKNSTTSIDVPTANFTITEITGDIFDAADNTVVIHACNCLGSWGAGIALAFKQRYPKAYKIYNDHCNLQTPTSLIGTALLIPPMETKEPRHYVGCLFTSKKYGRGRDSPAQILKNTGPAMEDLVNAMVEEGGKIEEIRMCQINSGLFAVPWAKSKKTISELNIADAEGVPKEIKVYSLPSAGAK
jgi:ADP-ribose 1''-phosphate phosphatase